MKHFALAGILLSWVVGYILVRRTRQLNVKTTSELGASSRSSYILFSIGILASTLLTALTVFGYLWNNSAIPYIFYGVFGYVCVLLVMTALLPDGKNLIGQLHYWAAWIMSYSLIALCALLFVDSYESFNKGGSMVNGVWHVAGVLFILAMAIVGTYTNREWAQPKHRHMGQQAYFVLFQIILLIRIYLV